MVKYLLVYASLLSIDVWATETGPKTEQHATNQSVLDKGSQAVNLLVLKPNKCVALRKGRKCFATVEVRWQVQTKGDYCLRRQHDQMVINCWQDQAHGDFSYVFGSENKEQLELVEQSHQRIVSTAFIQVSWVYKSKRKKSRWRIF